MHLLSLTLLLLLTARPSQLNMLLLLEVVDMILPLSLGVAAERVVQVVLLQFLLLTDLTW